MAAYCWVYDSRHLQANCQEPSQLRRNPTLGNRLWATFIFLTPKLTANREEISRWRFLWRCYAGVGGWQTSGARQCILVSRAASRRPSDDTTRQQLAPRMLSVRVVVGSSVSSSSIGQPGSDALMGPIYKISYDLSQDYRKFIVRSAYGSDLQRAKSSLGNVVS